MCLCAWFARRPGCQCADPATTFLSGGGQGLRSIRPGGIQAGWLGPGSLDQQDPGLSAPRLEARERNSARRGVKDYIGEARVSFPVSCHRLELSVCWKKGTRCRYLRGAGYMGSVRGLPGKGVVCDQFSVSCLVILFLGACCAFETKDPL